jgi:probable HAF family extracellular repeat protein
VSQAPLLNDDGQVVGWSYTADGFRHAFSWTQAGGLVDLGTISGGSSLPTAVNESGQVVGESASTSGQLRAFSWTAAGGIVDLGTLAGSCMCVAHSRAYAVTDGGKVIGVSSTAAGEEHAFSWTQGGGMVDLGNLGLTSGMEIQAVSDSGQFVGSTLVSGGHAFSWTQADGLVDLGTLGGLGSTAWAVNDSGQVVGSSDTTGDFERHAFVWTNAGGMVDLGTFGGTVSEARDVNEAGQIVGGSSTGGVFPSTHAVLWKPAGDSTLPTLALPADIALDATGPNGTQVTYTVTATDDIDPSPTVNCSPPSGSVFAIGDTTVACTATDAAGKVASGSFQVHVRGAEEQVAALIALVDSYGLGKLGTSLHDKLVTVERFLAAGKLQQAEDNLEAFIAQVDSQRSKGLTNEQADALETAAERILDVIVT